MDPVYEKLLNCVKSVREKTDFVPAMAVVLGSGLGDFADGIEISCIIDYHEIEGFPVSTAFSHKGRFVFGYVDEIPVVCMQGRVHYYEGYPITDVVLPIRLMGLLGAKTILLTNASGGIRADLNVGDLMMITGHISTFAPNPLIVPNLDELGTRFPDMTEVYRRELQEKIRESAARVGVELKEGTYVQLTGPSYETPQEIEMLRILGGDAVGMSTVVEAIAANHMGLRVCGISCIANKASGMNDKPLSSADIEEASIKVAHDFKALVSALIPAICK